jgi:hypothetical protein
LVVHTTNYVLGVSYSCGVVLVFWFWREIVFGVTYVFSVQYSCAVVSFLLLWRESYFCTNTLQSRSFLKNIKNFFCKKIDYLLNLRTRRPTLSCFVWIYNHTDTIVSQKYRELCLISLTILIGFLYFRETAR